MVINHVSTRDVHPKYSQAGDAYASWDTSGFKLLGRLAKSIHGQAPASTKNQVIEDVGIHYKVGPTRPYQLQVGAHNSTYRGYNPKFLIYNAICRGYLSVYN